MRRKGSRFPWLKNKEPEEIKDFPPVENNRPADATYPPIDTTTSQTFIYISNFSRRDYQFEIALTAVTANTLVIIPTSLGKTFIAALLIFNYYRWFPTGKIIFIAPTRPLVSQQMKSVQETTQIVQSDIAEITGAILPETRASKWKSARVFFATAQTVQKDIEKGICPTTQIVLLVVDEAHRASGNHSYCVVVRQIASVTKFFRVVALTATPGSTFSDVQQVIYNLLIHKIEIRDDNDCAQYIHSKDIQSEIVPNAEGTEELLARLNSILQFYLIELRKFSLVSHVDPLRTTKGSITKLLASPLPDKSSYPITQAIRILNLREKLEGYSIPLFVRELTDLLRTENVNGDEQFDELRKLLETAKRLPQVDNKMEKLTEIVVNFLQSSVSSKIIIFCNYRKIVSEIVQKLSASSNIVKCTEFIGQSSKSDMRGQNQSKQLKVMDAFKRGIYNTLVSTSIGEEGLDIGEVDLIICYDAQKSPVRTIQRMGRTGRHQDGHVIFLLTESTQNLLHNAENAQNTISSLITRRRKDFVFYQSPPMNTSKFEVIFKQMQIRDFIHQTSTKEIKRATLLTSEIEELHERHGERLFYPMLSLDKYLYIQSSLRNCNYTASSESEILSKLLNINAESDLHLSEQLKHHSATSIPTTFSFELDESIKSNPSTSSIDSLSIPSLIPLSSEDEIPSVKSYNDNTKQISNIQKIVNALILESTSSQTEDETLGGFLVHSSDITPPKTMKKKFEEIIDEISETESSTSELSSKKEDNGNKENVENIENKFLDSESTDFLFGDTSDVIKETQKVHCEEEKELKFEFSESSSFVSESSDVIEELI
ncbi:Type III restriction enzyme, res subunit family protein [Histomonas meleagridis]|uniref:Type III restriction enzyme, res subunit family protein n=1 Tax=Histomonas meleagridis TaxID=135588 RepID=UPI003559F4EE|nr:Type III restriction enzyme, res subunit family protein [Histomonas meleagridis]KAH0801244.1 Type III restriction enzyme, res subunit family protein [Histomonas meleagridis]